MRSFGGYNNDTKRLRGSFRSTHSIRLKKNLKEIIKIKADCEQDMAPYASSIIRLFTNNKIENLKVFKNYFNKIFS